MCEDRVIEQYVIGGAIASIFYTEPILTYDLDVFIILPGEQRGLTSLSSIYTYLERKGYKAHKKHLLIEGMPVQFIPAYNDLVEEAIRNPLQIKFGKTKTNIVRVEYPLAILLQTYRPKDKARIV